MHPLDLALAANGVGQAVQAVADNPIDPLDAGSDEGISELIGNGSHDTAPRVPPMDLGNQQQVRKTSTPRAPPKS
jgi:hypothetical protein